MGIESLDIGNLDLSAPVGPQLTAALRQSIIRNQLKPGMRLSEAEIGARFGISRQPVREAFIKLAEEGLLEIRPQRGSFVRKISLEAVMDARFVREAVEADIVKACAADPAPGLVEELRDQIEAQQRLVDDRPAAFVPLDDMFHRTLAQAAGRPNAWAVIEGMKTQMDRVRQMTSINFPLAHLITQHNAVVDAIEAHDPQAAEQAMRGHLRMILQDLPAIREDFPDYFDPSGE
ncbi:MAG: GntR family transcriptional regulator [Rhodobacteraceae bacterium]|uniref:GntR family transcriptional regulator n=1 Tax=Salipiger thiooxidans TaxID=282683 RepID=UPI001A8E5A11|nr:GntR family transcriptional regulator [Salipiger thiooxidans]MBN8189135.1 GntR family transcriptional regulator [Salipiger thiooxidans]MBR9839200.1 GntR family transcriptional regulator [Paracoccaceae bacterium]